jgi:hypothetical protein
VVNKKTKVNRALQILKEFKSKPRYKDKYGNNVKQHFGIYKYFINTQTQAKEKFYISLQCFKLPAAKASKVIKSEQETLAKHGKHYYLERIRTPGMCGVTDRTRLEYWGLPPGLCE